MGDPDSVRIDQPERNQAPPEIIEPCSDGGRLRAHVWSGSVIRWPPTPSRKTLFRSCPKSGLGQSLSWMVPVAVPVARVAPRGWVRTSWKVSVFSVVLSFLVWTFKVVVVCKGLRMSVPVAR